MFEGYDYAELLSLLFGEREWVAEEGQAKLHAFFFHDHIAADHDGFDAEAQTAIGYMKEFLKALLKYQNYHNPVFEGLLKVEDDYTFCQLFVTLLPAMWD